MKIFKESNLTEEFKQFLERDYDIDLVAYLLEILNKNEPIKLDSEYLNNYYNRDDIKEEDVWQYKDDKVFKELKDDMSNWANEIKTAVEAIPGVSKVSIVGSNQAGLSTYLNVNFKRPDEKDPVAKERLKDDAKFLNHYFSGFGQDGGYDGEYRLKFRISNHPEKHISNTNVFMNAVGHNFDWIKNNIVSLCEKRAQQLQNYWKDYCRTGIISPKQIRRNQERKNQLFLHLEYLNKGYIDNKYISLLKETFGKDRLMYMLDPNTIEYLDNADIDLEDIIYEVETEERFKRYDYIKLINAVAHCLNSYIIEYTFDNGFDYDLFVQDVQDTLTGKQTSKPAYV